MTAYSPPLAPNTTVTATKKSLKRVRFGGIRGVQDAEERHSFCEEQMEFMWYSKDELKAQRKICKHILKGKIELSDQDCYRGLEVYANNNRKQRLQDSVFPVLKMHWEGRYMGQEDDTRGLRSLASILNREALQEGVARAAQDMAEAFAIYQECSTLVCQTMVKNVFLRNTYTVSTSDPVTSSSFRMARSA